MTEPKKDISRIFREDRHLIDEALQRGIDQATLQHKRAGLAVVIQRDGKIEWVMPEDLGY
jgi:hypothetical protein